MTRPVESQPSTAAVLAVYQQSIDSIRQQVASAIEALWNALTSWRDSDIKSFSRSASTIVAAGQRQVASLTEAYLNQTRTIRTGSVARSKGIATRDVIGSAVRNGARPEDVYFRSGEQVWNELHEQKEKSQPTDLKSAVESGMKRAVKAAQTDLQLTKTAVSQKVLSKDPDATGYRRVLEGAYSCALCIVASTQRYHKEDLMPIHPACDCSVAALYGDDKHVIDSKTLADAHDLIKETFGVSDAGARNPDYRKFIVVHDHGELGPLLGVRGQNFTSPSDLFKH